MEIKELLEQIAIAESKLERQREDMSQYDPNNIDDWDDLAKICVEIQVTERNFRYLRDQLKLEQDKIKSESP